MSQEQGRTVEPSGLRAHLLEADAIDTARLDKFRKEVSTVFTQKLTRKSRAWWVMGLCSSIVFALCGAAILVMARMDLTLEIIWTIYTAANVAMVGFSAWTLRRGELDRGHLLALSKLSPAAALFIAILLVVQAIAEPGIAALAWSVFGLICVVFAVAITLYNRVVAAEISTREQILRLELRIVDLAEAAEKRHTSKG